MTDLELDDVELTGVDEHPPDSSVKLYGPPGTGKTTQSAGRVARLLQDYGYRIDDVAWCTYRKSLATETLERLAAWDVLDSEELDAPSQGATRCIGTTHAVANRVAETPVTPDSDVDVASTYHKRDFCKKRNLRWQKRSEWDEPPGQLLFDVFSYMQNNLLDPERADHLNDVPMIDDLRSEWNGNVAAAWRDWANYKRERGLIDYYEMLARPLENKTVPDRDILVVDEYHDATPLMAKLCEFWADHAEIVIVAGDPNQVVNSYAGADPEFFERIDLPTVLLDKTYRVPYEHWAVASHMLAKAHEPPEVERTRSGGFYSGTSPMFSYDESAGWRVPAPSDAYGPVWLVEQYGTNFMFLTRTQKQADGIAYALEKAGVLYKTQGSMNRDGWEARSADDTSTRTSIYNALQKLTPFSRADFSSSGLNQWQSGSGANPRKAALSSTEAADLLDYTNHQYLAQSRGETETIAEEIRDEERAITLKELSAYVTEEFWSVYTSGAGSVRHLNKGELSERDREALKNALRRNDDPVRDVETKVYTIHASKGTEAENVAVYDGVTSKISSSVESDPDARANEWRTWYVALTRAKENMIVLDGGFQWVTPWLFQSTDNLLDIAQRGRALATDAGVTA